MTDTPQKRQLTRESARDKCERKIDEWKRIVLDRISTPGYYGKQSLTLHTQDGIFEMAEELSQKTQK